MWINPNPTTSELHGYNFNSSTGSVYANDGNGHGTLTAGIIGAGTSSAAPVVLGTTALSHPLLLIMNGIRSKLQFLIMLMFCLIFPEK